MWKYSFENKLSLPLIATDFLFLLKISCILGNFANYHFLCVQIAIDENGVSKGYGFVHFERDEDAKRTIAKVNGMLIKDKKL